MIKERNTCLQAQIEETELVAVMLRCILQYRKYEEHHRGQDFWREIAPLGLVDIQTQTKEALNPLMNFLKNGDLYYQILFVEGAITPMQELEKAYSTHMKYAHRVDKAQIGSDWYPIKAAGFTIGKAHLCKHCHLVAKASTCGDHYNAKNRYRKVVVHGMEIVKKAPIVEEEH